MSRATYTLATLLILASSLPAVAQKPASRPSREQYMMRMRYDGRFTEEDLARPALEIVQEFLQTDDRRLLDMQVRLLRRKVLKAEQIDQIIKAAENPAAESQRVYCWQVLLDSGAPTAHAFLEKTFAQKTDEGMVLQFLQQAEIANVSSVPLVIRLFETQHSDLVRAEIIRTATGTPRPPMDSGGYNEGMRLEAVRTTLLSGLLQHAGTDEEKEQLLTGRSMSAAIADDARAALGSIKSAETRARIYKHFLRYPQEPWFSFLLTDEKDPQIQADVIRRVREDLELGVDRGMGGEIPASLRAAAANAAPPVKAETQKLMEVLRKRAIEQMFARLKQTAAYRVEDMPPGGMNPRMLRPVEAEVEDNVQRLKMQYGALPEEAQLRARLRTELEGYRKRVEQAQTKPQ